MKEKLLYEGMRCPVCENSQLKLRNQVTNFEYKGVPSKIEKEVLKCDACEEFFFQPKDEREIEKILADERRKIDGLLTTSEIKAIRNKFGMSQVNFSKFLRLSEKAFARYESGQSNQNVAVDNLLRVLRDYPTAIEIFNSIPRKATA